jgi:large subunit ribosomal protein L24
MNNKMKIVKGDQVIVTTGKDKGRTGEVIKVMPQDRKVVVKGVNVVKKHQKPSREGAGAIVQKELPIDVSNVALIDPKTKKATRVAIKVAKDGSKQRVAKKSGEVLQRPGVDKAAAAAKGKGKK